MESKPGEGASFQLFLKRSDKDAEPTETIRKPPATAERGQGRLLVVEDDKDVLAVTVEMLSGLGYEVRTAQDAGSAIQVLQDGEPVDLLFSDVIMPGGRNGVELARLARNMRPDLKVLLTSGYVGEANTLAGDAFELIDKPYQRSDLAARLNGLLSADGRRGGRGHTKGGEDVGQASVRA